MFQRCRRILWSNSRKPLTWRSIGLLALVTWTLRYVVVAIYCCFMHTVFFRFTSCPTENNWPKNFSDIGSITFIAEPPACDRASIIDQSIMEIIVFIPVHASRLERRDTIRRTWAKSFKDAIPIEKKRLVTKLIFVIGSMPLIKSGSDHVDATNIQERLRQESMTHNDILQLGNVIDSYYNITLKIRSVLDWASRRCPRAAYIVRADSDVVLDYANLLRFLFWLSHNHTLGNNGSDHVIAGYCRPYDCVTRWPTSKTCLPRSVYRNLPWNKYDGAPFLPRYCFGFSYVLSTGFVAKALKVWSQDEAILSTMRVSAETRANLFRYWPLDDIFVTGYLAETLETAPRLNHPHTFTYTTKFDTLPCHGSGVVASGAYEDEEEMRRRWAFRQEKCQWA